MVADHLTKRIWSWGNDRTTVQVYARHDGKFRVVQLERIEESSRYRETRGETCDSLADAEERFEAWARAAGRQS